MEERRKPFFGTNAVRAFLLPPLISGIEIMEERCKPFFGTNAVRAPLLSARTHDSYAAVWRHVRLAMIEVYCYNEGNKIKKIRI